VTPSNGAPPTSIRIARSHCAPTRASQCAQIVRHFAEFVPFGLKEGTNFMEYDLVYLRGDLLFWGARNIDGRGFNARRRADGGGYGGRL
jgi:hypothetical protein